MTTAHLIGANTHTPEALQDSRAIGLGQQDEPLH
jgi:hypothetical protein